MEEGKEADANAYNLWKLQNKNWAMSNQLTDFCKCATEEVHYTLYTPHSIHNTVMPLQSATPQKKDLQRRRYLYFSGWGGKSRINRAIPNSKWLDPIPFIMYSSC